MQNWLGKAFFLTIGGLVVAGLVLAFWPEPTPVEMAQAKRDTVLVTVDEDGKTRIKDKYVVSAPLSGRLLRIDLDPGDTVEADKTVLTVLEPRDPELLDARTLAQTEARVHAAQALLAKTAIEIERAMIEADNAESEMMRVRQAASGGGLTQSELETAETRHKMAAEGIRVAQYAREIAEFELDQAKAALIRSQQNGPSEVEEWAFPIRSPIDGRVLRVFQESSAVVTAGTPLLELGAPSDLEVEVDVLSSDAVAIQPGDRVILERWGGARPLEGRVRLIEPAGFTKVSSLGVEEQRVNAIIDLVDPPDQRRDLGDGFRVEARIVTDEAKDVVTVPASALFRQGDRWSAFKVVEGVAKLTPVTVGRRNDTLCEITEGITEGDTVVIHPSDRVSDGVRVREL
ncbi:efflux RND transporter periplasmic adaptor subunit [Botrimarina mediterranea]|uniref:Efflux system component YknX n=1 Tax=Botrimarina mediterranea TaxID=2528022 RepID=A0A518KDJ0_9BACT|nr:HlyD family efflux transporter periplasmic adaptor subunit [Botrimarina mediterranea]QDV75857.1 Putative efflux system component YknX [Botrimarina mediterranea]QDV80454.1 Putative efflux system component YknX [Planctomycetes bacterium K2D]